MYALYHPSKIRVHLKQHHSLTFPSTTHRDIYYIYGRWGKNKKNEDLRGKMKKGKEKRRKIT